MSSRTPLDSDINTRFPTPRRTRSALRRSQEVESPDIPGRFSDFVEATFENWESEFLQMGMYVVLTAFLYQRGSSESKPLNEPAPQDQDPREATANQSTPWPVRSGGWVLALYEHSLAIAFFVLFFASWALHAMGGVKAFNEEQLQHGEAAISV